MRNSFFRFKQFTVYQDKCAMKVGTDGVLLGVLADISKATRILDIGTGTGLIALMLAQRQKDAHIDAIEIDEQAAQQAQENIAQSPFCHIHVHTTALQAYNSTQPYDLIVSNPPYFVNSLKAPNAARNLARHTDSLSFADLLQGADRLLHNDGCFWVILPHEQTDAFCTLAKQQGLYPYHKVHIYPRSDKPAKRIVMGFIRQNTGCIEEDLIIETEQRHTYSPAFARLTAPFYLD